MELSIIASPSIARLAVYCFRTVLPMCSHVHTNVPAWQYGGDCERIHHLPLLPLVLFCRVRTYVPVQESTWAAFFWPDLTLKRLARVSGPLRRHAVASESRMPLGSCRWGTCQKCPKKDRGRRGQAGSVNDKDIVGTSEQDEDSAAVDASSV